MKKRVMLPLTDKTARSLKAGDEVLLNGKIYTARDQAHKRLVEAIKSGKRLPVVLKGQIIYYCGPTPARPGKVIGSAGPTTSSRMDGMTAPLLKLGLMGMIGKGTRSKDVMDSIRKHKAEYFVAVGGAGALLAKRIISAKVVAYTDLGPEAIFELKVKDFPAFVAFDTMGQSIFK